MKKPEVVGTGSHPLCKLSNSFHINGILSLIRGYQAELIIDSLLLSLSLGRQGL